MIRHVTDFADQAVILPVVALAFLALLATGWWRAALAWACVVPGTLFVVLAGKMITSSCQLPRIDTWSLHNPSGHTASAALVYGGLAALLIPFGRPRLMAVLWPAAAAVVIGFSRLALGMHTSADVLVGGAIGIAGASLLVLLAGPRPEMLHRRLAVLAALAVIMVLFHGRHVYAETWIGHHAARLWPFAWCRW